MAFDIHLFPCRQKPICTMSRFTTFVSAAVAASTLLSPVVDAACTREQDDTCPMQLRLAYAGHDGMVVSWNTYSQLSHPSVRYGKDPHHLDKVARTLEPNTVYHYLPLDSNVTGPYSFKTSRHKGDHTPYSMAVVVDLGLIGADGLSTTVGNGAANPLKPGDNNTLQSLMSQGADTDFLWHRRKIQGYLPNTTLEEGAQVYESLLNQYYDEMTPITAFKPYMVTTVEPRTKSIILLTMSSICLPGQTNFTGLINHFRMPSKQSGGLGNFWYSFDYGMVHYVQLDTETDLGHGYIAPDEPNGTAGEDAGPFSNLKNAQTDWLAKDLASVDRKKTPWVVVAGHRPWYISIGTSAADICYGCKDVFEPLFLKYGVDLVLAGHVHAYERNAPIANWTADPRGLENPSAPWYIVNGAAGHYDGLDTLVEPRNNYSRFSLDTVYGWSRLTFHNCSHLTHEFVGSANGTVLDTATLFKDRDCGGHKSH
ncbi:hypothetical protein ARAM_000912 [Aspergillus rambellii]|uniref:Purple acid phosphatase n=1 Tax=Aspergillus rambellii TaxID=308745 RepID=A0A0F8URH3_9EURO|nr:hypothetical protein ARAM_000912 [Aspergillus rambellii]